MARTEIGLIIDELVTLEKTLTETAAAFDETPETVGATPAWLNFPRSGTLNEQTGWAEDNHTLVCACVKRRALLPADEAMMRPLITKFPDLLSDNLSLGGTVAHVDEVRYEYGLIEGLSSPEEPMFGVLFTVDVTCKDTVSVGL